MKRIAILLLLINSLSYCFAQQCSTAASNRIDCYPEGNVTPQNCQQRGCCWLPDQSENLQGIPWCFFPENFGYTASNFVKSGDTLTATLKNNQAGPYGADVTILSLQVQMMEDTVRIKITDAQQPRWEVPWVVVDEAHSSSYQPTASDYTVSWTESPFGIAITRLSTGSVIWNTTLGGFIYEDQFLQISTTIPQGVSIYGIGEHVEPILQDLQYNTQTGFACDQGTPTGGTNLYGNHPFFLGVESDGNAYGGFLLNSNAMEVVLQPRSITYRTLGGIFDFYVFVGKSPANVVEQYTNVIGRSFMPPYWSLGFHLCRWGYGTLNATETVVETMREYQIPQDVQWNDIDYMDRWLDFTLDPKNFPQPKMAAFLDKLHANGQHYVMITDPGISNEQGPGNYAPYDQGIKAKIFINGSDGAAYVGQVWPGKTVFPDFFHPESHQWWKNQVAQFHTQLAFDGLWIDMNEPSNFIDSNCNASKTKTGFNPNYPPYLPHIARGYMDAKTVCMNSVQYPTIHYNVHNMYGLSEARATMAALKEVRGKRTIVISRSTFPSSGRHGGHWLGDNASSWPDLYYSIPGMLNMNMFGVSLVGADICGFGGPDTTQELCTRWMQLGAFYPFSRNHNAIGKKGQEPYVWGNTTAGYMRDALLIRYSILPYMYTLFYESHVFGRTVVRPLVFEYPRDINVRAIDKQFLVGSSFLVSPVLTEGATSVAAYFPEDVWYDFRTGGLQKSGNVILDAPISYIPLHIRGGIILPRQGPALTTTASRLNPYNLVVALKNGDAMGTLYLDDGESLDSISKSVYNLIKYTATGSSNGSSGTLSSLVAQWTYNANLPQLEAVTIYGVSKTQSSGSVVVNGVAVNSFTYNAQTQVLTIDRLNLSMRSAFSLKWSI